MLVFYSDDYVADAAGFDTVRKAGEVAASLATDPIPGAHIVPPTPATAEELTAVHTDDYVHAILTGVPTDLAASAGLGWDRTFATAVTASAGGCRDAATAAWADGVAGTLSSGLHHARRDSGDGYCTVNGVALAAVTFLAAGAERVLVVDLDAHCGGGTVDILAADPRVTQVDVATSCYDRYDPPPGWSLDIVRDAECYLATIEARLADAGDFDAVVYNAGMDPHELCSIGGLDGVDDEALAAREHMVFQFAASRGTPIAFTLAGGYSSSRLTAEHLVRLHRLTVAAATGVSR